MKVDIIKAEIHHPEDCKSAVLQSKLGQEYFTTNKGVSEHLMMKRKNKKK